MTLQREERPLTETQIATDDIYRCTSNDDARVDSMFKDNHCPQTKALEYS